MTLLPPPRLGGSGPSSAKIMVVTEAATADDIWKGKPLAGTTGNFFNKLLHEAGILRSECYVTTVLKSRPKGDDVNALYTQTKSKAQKLGLGMVQQETWVHHSLPGEIEALHLEVARVRPLAIIALGDLAMFALTGVYGSVDTWRGSHLDLLPLASFPCTVIPTYPPAAIYKQWAVKGFCIRDLQRAKDVSSRPELYTYPAYTFHIRPTFERVRSILISLIGEVSSGKILPLSVDIETIARRVSCIGFAWNVREALCIPFMTLDGHYWTEEEEIEICFLLKELLTHPLCSVIGQNFQYDAQYFARYLGYLPNLTFDTMLAQHTIFPGIPKALDFLSSMYCHWHRFWKDELNDYNRLPENMTQYWEYNCKDCCITFEVYLVLIQLLNHMHMEDQFRFQMKMNSHAITTMLRGVRVNVSKRSELAGQLMTGIMEHDTLIQQVTDLPLNTGSAVQMKAFFYDDLKLPVQLNRKTRQPSLDKKALDELSKKEPLLRPLIEIILKKRSLGVYLSTFIQAPLSSDKRLRTQYNIAGTETFRLSSSTDAFGEGLNMQNISSGKED